MLYGHAGNAPIKRSIRMITRIVPMILVQDDKLRRIGASLVVTIAMSSFPFLSRRFAFSLGLRHFSQLALAHRFVHTPRCALER